MYRSIRTFNNNPPGGGHLTVAFCRGREFDVRKFPGAGNFFFEAKGGGGLRI